MIYLNLNEIKENPKNPRFIKDDKFKKLVKSIKEFPKMLELRPLVLDENNIVLGGNMRLKALTELGYEKAPVLFAKDLTEEQKKEFIIKDNVGFGEWDFDLLANEWEPLQLEEWGLDLPGITDLINIEEAEEDNFEIKEDIKTDIVKGDLFGFYKDGKELHRLLCGDSTNVDEVEKLMNGEKADLIITDPPYGVDYKGIKNDDRAGLEKLLNDVFVNYLNFSKKGTSFYCFHSDKCADIFHKIYRDFCHFSSMIIWQKESIVLSQTDYQSKHEPCLYGWLKNGTHKFYGDRKQESILLAKSKKEDGHTTPKPIEILIKFIKNSSLQNNIIIDFFLGSGSTMVASHQLNRKCYGIELSEKYCQVIIDRMKKLDPTLEIKKI